MYYTPKEIEVLERMAAYGGKLYKRGGGWSEYPHDSDVYRSWYWSCSSETIKKLLIRRDIVRESHTIVRLKDKQQPLP